MPIEMPSWRLDIFYLKASTHSPPDEYLSVAAEMTMPPRNRGNTSLIPSNDV